MDKRYGRAVDWWAFGVLIYQMLLQQSPFRGEDEDEIYDAILADEPLYPIHMPRDSVSILQKVYSPQKLFASLRILTYFAIASPTRAREASRLRPDRRPGNNVTGLLPQHQLGRHLPQARRAALQAYNHEPQGHVQL